MQCMSFIQSFELFHYFLCYAVASGPELLFALALISRHLENYSLRSDQGRIGAVICLLFSCLPTSCSGIRYCADIKDAKFCKVQYSLRFSGMSVCLSVFRLVLKNKMAAMPIFLFNFFPLTFYWRLAISQQSSFSCLLNHCTLTTYFLWK